MVLLNLLWSSTEEAVVSLAVNARCSTLKGEKTKSVQLSVTTTSTWRVKKFENAQIHAKRVEKLKNTQLHATQIHAQLHARSFARGHVARQSVAACIAMSRKVR